MKGSDDLVLTNSLMCLLCSLVLDYSSYIVLKSHDDRSH